MMSDKFKVGDIVTLKPGKLSRSYTARVGEKALVIATKENDPLGNLADEASPSRISLTWRYDSEQRDGAYDSTDFTLYDAYSIYIEKVPFHIGDTVIKNNDDDSKYMVVFTDWHRSKTNNFYLESMHSIISDTDITEAERLTNDPKYVYVIKMHAPLGQEKCRGYEAKNFKLFKPEV